MKLTQPPTPKEIQDLRQAFRNNIPEPQFLDNPMWFQTWGDYLIGLRRSYQHRWLSEAYNEHSSNT